MGRYNSAQNNTEPNFEHRPEEVQKKMGRGEREVLGLRGILGKMGNQEMISGE